LKPCGATSPSANMSQAQDWQSKVLCRYFMMGVCQRGDTCPYSHDRSISNKGTIPCRFYQAGTCANWSNCRFSHGEPEPEPMMNQLTISLEAGMSLEESDLGSETSSGYCDSVPPYLEPQYQIEGAAVAQQSAFFASPMGTMSPTFYPASPSFCEQAIYCDPGYEDPLQGVQYEEPPLGPVVPLPTGLPQTRLTSPPSAILDPPLRSAQAAHHHKAEPSVAPCRNSTEKPPVSVESHLDGDCGGLLKAPVSHSDNLETAAAAAGPPLPVDPPLLTPLPGSKSWAAPTNWAEAKEFVPKVKVEKPRSWAQVVNTGVTYPGCELSIAEAESLLCPFYRVGECRYGVGCAYIHGQQCDYCGQAVLHPTHLDQRRGHLAECLQEHERDMELSFAVARSKEKTCGICMETVLDKPKGEARFGILPNCTHCFCLPCIRKWRQAKQFEHKIIRACPECRQTSDYICPSRFWVETTEEKGRLLTDYKKNLGQKECKYFNKGVGECPFGNKCFYQHADKEGRTVDVGPPKKPLRRANADGNLTLVQRLLLYDFLEERDGQLVLPLDFVELLDLYSDDSDEWSDSETN